MTVFGVHAGLQNTSIGITPRVVAARRGLGFDWISIWDHFYSADFTDGSECLEAVADARRAARATRARCGAARSSTRAGYRHPAVLANAIATIDHLSGGRADIGLGAGWAFNRVRRLRHPVPSAKVRLDILEEAVQCVRGLLRDEVADFKGEHFTLTNARCEPEAGAGRAADLDRWRRREAHAAHRRRSTPTAGTCRSSTPDDVRAQARRARSGTATPSVATRPTSRCAVNVGLAYDEESLRQQFGGLAELRAPGRADGGSRRRDRRPHRPVRRGRRPTR